HWKARRATIPHRTAGRACEDAVDELFGCGVCLEVAYYIDHLDAAFVRDTGKEILVEQEGDDRNELRGGAGTIIYIASRGSQDADVCAVGVSIRVVHHPVQLALLERWRACLPEEPEAPGRLRIQLVHVDAVRGVEGIVEIEGRGVKPRETAYWCRGLAHCRAVSQRKDKEAIYQCTNQEMDGSTRFLSHPFQHGHPPTESATEPPRTPESKSSLQPNLLVRQQKGQAQKGTLTASFQFAA